MTEPRTSGAAARELRDIVAYWNDELAYRRTKGRPYRCRMREEWIGGLGDITYTVDGQPVDMHLGIGMNRHKRWAYEVLGRPWISGVLSVPESGVVGEPVCDYDRPPTSRKLRVPALYAIELERRPRPADLVPGWMKVELAVVGAWDLVRDVATWTSDGPSGEFQTPELVGVEPPPGAEWALPVEEVPRD